ncbi:MAG: glucokinase, partial [Inhella sp.]
MTAAVVRAPATIALAGAPGPWLVADIGGSNARFGWVPQPGGQPLHVRTLAVAEYPELLDAVRAYLGGLSHAGLVAGQAQPHSAAFAVATAAHQDRIEFTNSSWCFSQQEMAGQLGLAGAGALRVLNDFEALALSLPRLRSSQWQADERFAGSARPDFGQAVAVVGPGTGLGVAALLPLAGGKAWQALPGEGGHATLAPQDDFESALLAAARREFAHVSAERLLSGI